MPKCVVLSYSRITYDNNVNGNINTTSSDNNISEISGCDSILRPMTTCALLKNFL